MSNCTTILSVLTKSGTDQKQRYADALQPENTSLIGFSVEDWILFAYNFANHVNYYNTTDDATSAGNWKSFFEKLNPSQELPSYTDSFAFERIKKNIQSVLEAYKVDQNLTPHLTLFVTFLLLLEESKKRFNGLTKRHLDFYYKDILNLSKQGATPDSVYLIFELAKNAVQEKISAETSFEGGKDNSGKTRNYLAESELIAGKTAIAAFKNCYHDSDTKKIVAAQTANSYDGMGTDFPDSATQWWPFGYVNDANYPDLPTADMGFAIASPILALNEGLRNLEFTFTFQNPITGLTADDIINSVSTALTTKKEWHNATPELTITVEEGTFTTGFSGNQMKIALSLNEDVDPIIGYDSAVYGDEFSTLLPIAKFNVDLSLNSGYNLYKSIAQNKLINLTIKTDVSNIKNVTLENDNSTINAKKPFFPFTSIPVKGSNFLIKYDEAFGKNWDKIAISLAWKNTPSSFFEHYKGYKSSVENSISILQYEGLMTKEKKGFNTSNQIVSNNAYFKFNTSVLSDNVWEPVADLQNKSFFGNSSPFTTSFELTNTNYNTAKNGALKLSLTTSFLHELYAKSYAMALATENKNVVLPNEPYTPLVESLTFGYSASETSYFTPVGSQNADTLYNENKAQLYQIHPFGYAEEHTSLKSKLSFVADTNSYLLPAYCFGGELYLALENAQVGQQVPVLFQMFEGSENPLRESFSGKQKVEWSVLGSNQWKTLGYDDIVLNETGNLLQTGIFNFVVPKEATANNTLLKGNYVWLKAKIHKKFDVVCKVTGIHSQVQKAVFKNNNNELSHLSTGLPAGTISKLTQRLSSVKSVTQPYNSFDGKPEETDSGFYQRISERLRHKNRCISMWDYEHILLQNFPELYKVKCLNHTSETSFLAPGYVTLVVIPDTVNKNVFDIYQPRVSTATLSKVKAFAEKLNSMHCTTLVVNPTYEEVTVSLKVKFKTGYDENYYSTELNTDITKFLSPWALDKSIPISFGAEIHISSLINYIEKLGYIDYLQDVRLLKDGALSDKKVVPSNPKSILVSAKSHVISTDIKTCSLTSTEAEETCQM